MIEYGNPVLTGILISVCSLVINLIVIFFFRALDKKDRKLENVKKLIDQFSAETERNRQTIRQEMAETENKVTKITGDLNILSQQTASEANALMSKVASQLKELQLYSDDLQRLRTAMNGYKKALDAVSVLTQDTQTKVDQVTEDAKQLDAVKDAIESFRKDMEEADAHLNAHEQRVASLESSSLESVRAAAEHANASVQESITRFNTERDTFVTSISGITKQGIDQVLEELQKRYNNMYEGANRCISTLDEKIKTSIEANEILTVSGKDALDNLCNRASDLILASDTLENLTDRRDELEKQLKELSDLKVLEEDNVNTARAEADRLSMHIQQLKDIASEEAKKHQNIPMPSAGSFFDRISVQPATDDRIKQEPVEQKIEKEESLKQEPVFVGLPDAKEMPVPGIGDDVS